MTKISTYIYRQKDDGYCAVALQLKHNGTRKFYKLLDVKSTMIKDGEIIDYKAKANIEMELSYRRKRLADIMPIAGGMSAEALYCHVFECEKTKDYKVATNEIDYIKYYKKHIEDLIEDGRKGTANSYKNALANLMKFTGEKLPIGELTKSFLIRYKSWMEKNGYGKSTIESCFSCHRSVHESARKEFNDEERGIMPVQYHPFDTIEYRIPSSQKRVRDNAITVEQIRLIHGLEFSEKSNVSMLRDVFMLSFILCGMNLCDMYELETLNKDGNIEYYRKKTKRRSGEGSHIILNIPDVAKPYMERLKGESHVFYFSEAYKSHSSMTATISSSMPALVECVYEQYAKVHKCSVSIARQKIGFPENMSFYSARHTFATIAANDCRVSEEVVDRCLCHSSGSLARRVYIKNDYRDVNDAMMKVVKKVFK